MTLKEFLNNYAGDILRLYDADGQDEVLMHEFIDDYQACKIQLRHYDKCEVVYYQSRAGKAYACFVKGRMLYEDEIKELENE